ncbi:MAG: endonuclease [Spirosoma sp.]|nr:endonuclease [Spirosoma sp.]
MKLQFFTHADNQSPATQVSVPVKVRRTNGLCYTDSEKQFMPDHWQTMTTAEIAQALGRSKASVATTGSKRLGLKLNTQAKYRAACLAQKNRKDAYSEAELQFLRDNYQTMSTRELANALGRP